MKVSLKSDFMDYYDHWFDREGEIVFERMSTGGMPRREMLEYLRKYGLNVPVFGPVEEVYDYLKKVYEFDGCENAQRSILDIMSVVVYLDEQAHRGEGKIHLSLNEALEKYPNHLCSEFIPTYPGRASSSFRYLQIGDRKWWLTYGNPDGWRSNYGENVKVEIIGEAPKVGYLANVKLPMFAVDFVLGNKLYAIDFNIAPGLKGTGIEEILKAEEVVGLIKKFYEDRGGEQK